MRVLLTVYDAPAWAEGKGRPSQSRAGTWRPQPALFAAFAEALARRYDGSFPDPLTPGATLPRVAYFEVWNEPNQDFYLAPQWDGKRLVGPAIYRNLVNAFYTAVKGVDPSLEVLAGSMSPFGDPPGGERTPPVLFLRSMLCLSGERLRPIRCPRPARFDILSDHPISFTAPTVPARSPLDVTPPDLPKLTRILRQAESTHRVLPAERRRPLWATEFWYITNPPTPGGLPLAKQARWYEQALHEVWKGGASAFFLQPFRDPPLGPSPEYGVQSGLYFADGRPKPSLTAMRFPFIAERLSEITVRIWGIAPEAGTVSVQVMGGGWRTVLNRQAAGPTHPFSATLRLEGTAKLRATIREKRSLTWNQG